MKSILIIGGGVSGLSAGIHAQLLGFSSTIVEKNPAPGGICTAWRRQGFHIDGSMHWLTGTQPGNTTYDMWRTLGVLGDNVRLIPNTSQGVYEYGGVSFNVPRDLDEYKRTLLEIAPRDRRHINRLVRDIRTVALMDMPAEAPVEFLPRKKKLELLLPMLRMRLFVGKRATMTNGEYAKRFKSPVLKKYFGIWPQSEDQHMGYLFKTAMLSRGNADYPEGGSARLVKNMVARYISLGGKILTSKEAGEIVTKDGVCTSVRFNDGTELNADYVLCACDPSVTLNRLLRGKYRVPEFEERYNDTEKYYLTSCFIAVFALDFIPEGLPALTTFTGLPLKVGHSVAESFPLRSFSFEPDFSPAGSLLLTMDITQRDADYEFWSKLRADNLAAYQVHKLGIANELLRRILTRFPEWQGHIRVIDTLTPATYNRYTGAYHGAWMAFRSKAGGKRMTHTGEIPGLKNVMLTGQWLQPSGGLPVAAAMSKFSVQRICKKEGMDFTV